MIIFPYWNEICYSQYSFTAANKVANFSTCPPSTVTAPMKDEASIQKWFFQSSTVVRFCKLLSMFNIFDCTKIKKVNLVLVNFLVRLIFKSVLCWCRYDNKTKLIKQIRLHRGPSICYVIKRGGWLGWAKRLPYNKKLVWSGLLVTFDYKWVGGFQKDQNLYYLIYGWSLFVWKNRGSPFDRSSFIFYLTDFLAIHTLQTLKSSQ